MAYSCHSFQHACYIIHVRTRSTAAGHWTRRCLPRLSPRGRSSILVHPQEVLLYHNMAQDILGLQVQYRGWVMESNHESDDKSFRVIPPFWTGLALTPSQKLSTRPNRSEKPLGSKQDVRFKLCTLSSWLVGLRGSPEASKNLAI